MSGLEKRLARFAQFYSRIGIVHEFRPLGTSETRRLLTQQWRPAGVNLPVQPWSEEAITAIIRITGGNFHFAESVADAGEAHSRKHPLRIVTKDAVEAARESLVIGQS